MTTRRTPTRPAPYPGKRSRKTTTHGRRPSKPMGEQIVQARDAELRRTTRNATDLTLAALLVDFVVAGSCALRVTGHLPDHTTPTTWSPR